MSEFSDFVTQWRAAGLLPPEGVPISPREPFNVAAYVANQRLSRWKDHCPEEFQKPINRSLIPNLAAWDEADNWDGTYPGIWLWSHKTGMAKSRMLWRKFCQLHVRNGKRILRITGMTLAEEYHDYFNRSKTSDFYRLFSMYDVIMLDDLDKMPLSEEGQGFSQQDQGARNSRMLRELFDKFYERHIPVLGTANESIKWFDERIGASGARRMHEVCREICFSHGTKT